MARGESEQALDATTTRSAPESQLHDRRARIGKEQNCGVLRQTAGGES